MSYVLPHADYRVTLDGVDLTDRLRPRLEALTLTERRGDEADRLEIVIEDTDGRFALPSPGKLLHVQIGWLRGSDVPVGLVDKGSFKVDEVEHGGPPDVITLRASSADFTSRIVTRREQSWRDTTIGAVVKMVAARNGLEPRCAAALASVALPTLHQSRESDMALLRRLGREYDAVATVKRGSLIFARVGAGVTSSGKAIPALTFARGEGDTHSYRLEKRGDVAGVSASWHDRGAATKKTVIAGEEGGARHLSRVYPTERAARAAADAALSRSRRQPASLDLTPAYGRPDIYPERKVNVRGFKPEIDARSWLVAEVSHTLDGTGGLSSRIKLETT
ncbi:contractile injection system protein, VgrG/Pvc8 family [Sphingomonas jatrophae]|uniref:Phage protein D n=1 Tax=Sphingomonas jatrophae TaxID=1166337 RepID=A0A1I6JLB2_9SPHN|nr:contractile injection system protein, VgrG/Pvc8 family [Sphingomonas jatrophae]SFR79729.1 hypothetical protein SAMN05192580_0446 [Sphingomonas jatrophae]